MDIKGLGSQIERVDDLPVVYGLLKQMSVQPLIDRVVSRHGNWQGLSAGWVITIWLMHILSEQNHLMEPVQKWVRMHQETLRRLTGQTIHELDFSDDRLALCLYYLHPTSTWHELESQMGQHLLRVYRLETETIRLDATVGKVNHDPKTHRLFQIGKAKDGVYGSLFKLMLASLDPLGLPLVVDVVAGNRADDPLYIPAYQRVKSIIGGEGKLIVGDSKMSAIGTRATIVAGKDYYLTPLAHEKDEPGLLDELLAPWMGREAEASLIFLPEELPVNGEKANPEHAIAYGFESTRQRSASVKGKTFTWEERLMVVRSKSYRKTMQHGLESRMEKAKAAFRALPLSPQRGKRSIQEEASLLAALTQIQQHYQVQGLFDLSYTQTIEERQIRSYKGTPARTERDIRFHLTVTPNEKAIALARFRTGWRIYSTNAPTPRLSLQQAVLAYRDQYLEENVFARLHGKFLSITPLYIQRDDHAKGLFHLLTIAARLLALGDYQVRQALAQTGSQLDGIYDGNPKRSTATPTTERLLKAFEHINLLILRLDSQPTHSVLTPLSAIQLRILTLLGLSPMLYTDLQLA